MNSPTLAMLTLAALVFIAVFALHDGALRSGLAWRIVDRPNHRSLHDRPIPRIGGLLLLPPALLAALVGGAPWPLLLAAAALYGLSLADDLGGLSAALRLAAHLLVAGLWAALALPGLSLPLLLGVVLAVAAMSNFFNFMDGSNGLAGGMALFGFTTLALLAPPPLQVLCLTLAAAALAFLVFNVDPARVFMGDAGSVPLGFLAAAIGAAGWQAAAWPLATPLFAFLPFWLDALITLLRRAARGEKVWQAHREHYYQRLIRLGWSHRRTAGVYYLLMALGAGTAIQLARQPAQALPLAGLWAALLLPLLVWVDRRWARHQVQSRND